MAEQETLLQKNIRARGETLRADLVTRRKDLANLQKAVAAAREAGVEDPSLTRLLDAATAAVEALMKGLEPEPTAPAKK